MSTIAKLAFTGLAAGLLMSFAVASASARRIRVSERGFLERWTSLSFIAGGNIVACPVTLAGSYHSRTISKVCGQLVGYLINARIPTNDNVHCTGGTATALTETLPWHVQYRQFFGTLPAISRKRLQYVGLRIRANSGVECLAGTTQSSPAVADINLSGVEDEEGIEATTTEFAEEFSIPLEGGFVCSIAGNGRISGTGEVFTLVTPQRRIRFKLVQ